MTAVTQLETAVRSLDTEELTAFRAWFADFDAEVWDRRFAEDVANGRLDQFAEDALDDHRAGRCTDL